MFVSSKDRKSKAERINSNIQVKIAAVVKAICHNRYFAKTEQKTRCERSTRAPVASTYLKKQLKNLRHSTGSLASRNFG